MVGLTKHTPVDHSGITAGGSSSLYMEIDDELDEEVQSLVTVSSSFSTHHRGRRSRRLLGSNSGSIGIIGRVLSTCYTSKLYLKCIAMALVGSFLMVWVYDLGKEQGRYGGTSSSSSSSRVGYHHGHVDHPYAPLSSPTTIDSSIPGVVAKSIASGDEPTYNPTPELIANPTATANAAGEELTYKPTPEVAKPPPTKKQESGTISTTPPPTPYPKTSWIDPDYPNPFISKFNTTQYNEFNKNQWSHRVKTSIDIVSKFGAYCKNKKDSPNFIPMCPELTLVNPENKKSDKVQIAVLPDTNKLLELGPTIKCSETGNKEDPCGDGTRFNKTIWPMIWGSLCYNQDVERKRDHPMPEELVPYYELGYDRVDPTKSTESKPFDGGKSDTNNDNKNDNNVLSFDPIKVKEHFLKFEAMLEYYYQGLAGPALDRHIAPMPEDPLYAPMLRSYADQIARVLIRSRAASIKGRGGSENKEALVIGVLGDSVTAGQDNCYYDAWPEAFRRQVAPLFESMGIKVEVRNAAKNGGWAMPQQLLCAHDMLGASDRPNDVGIDFIFLCAPFVKGTAIDAEHLIRRALLGKSHTPLSITVQNNMNKDKMLERYAKLGLTVGTPMEKAVSDLGYPPSYKYWFSPQFEAFWGMQDDGYCHLTTRSGSSSILNRNWHWGPKVHQSYGDAYALLFSRAARLAIDNLSSGRMPSVPPKPNEVNQVMVAEDLKQKEDELPSWKNILFTDMGSDVAVQGGIGGVRCAVGPANQEGSILLPHWLRPAGDSPFEEKMKARNGVSFVPSDHDAEDSDFYNVQSPISGPNRGVPVGDWVADPKTFGAEAPRTPEQCRHVDGSTMVNMQRRPDTGVSWLVWEVPEGMILIGHALICIPRGSTGIQEGAMDEGKVRFHYAVPGGNSGEWKVIEDSHKSKPMNFVGQNCVPVVQGMNEADLKAVQEGGMWAAVEWQQEAIFNFDYLVVM